MESIAAALQQLDSDGRARFFAYLESVLRSDDLSEKEQECIRELTEGLGLLDE